MEKENIQCETCNKYEYCILNKTKSNCLEYEKG